MHQVRQPLPGVPGAQHRLAQLRLRHDAMRLVFLALLGLIIFAESGLLIGFFLPGDSLLFAVALAVGLSPELLPAIISVTLAASTTANTATVGRTDAQRTPEGRDRPRHAPERAHGRALRQEDRLREGERAVMVASHAGQRGRIVVGCLWRRVLRICDGGQHWIGSHDAADAGDALVIGMMGCLAQLVRTVAFSGAGSALWALLPVIGQRQLGLGATGFGLLMGIAGFAGWAIHPNALASFLS